jgi:hypothetical protein
MKTVAAGVECSCFFIKLYSGCFWLLVRGRGGRWEALSIHPKKFTDVKIITSAQGK